MKISMLRPLLFKALNRLFSALRGKGSIVELGERVRFGRACEVKLERHAFARFGDDVKLRSGCILQVAKDARLELASQVELRHYALIECGHSVSVGRRSVIGAYNWLQGSGTITIGSDVIMGPGVRIISTTHDSSNAQCTFAELPLIPGEVVIGDNVWIGANVIILSGVTIGKNVIIGAGALVNRDLPENGVYVGVPARRIKDINSQL